MSALSIVLCIAKEESTGTSGIPWGQIALIAPAATALIAFLTFWMVYRVGLYRPLKLKNSRCWKANETVLFTTLVTNRVFRDRTLTSLALVNVPSRWSRMRHPRWRRTPQKDVSLIPWGADIEKIRNGDFAVRSRDHTLLRGEIRSLRSGHVQPAKSEKFVAFAGSKRSNFSRIEWTGI